MISGTSIPYETCAETDQLLQCAVEQWQIRSLPDELKPIHIALTCWSSRDFEEGFDDRAVVLILKNGSVVLSGPNMTQNDTQAVAYAMQAARFVFRGKRIFARSRTVVPSAVIRTTGENS